MLYAIFSDVPGEHDPTPRAQWTFAGAAGILDASVTNMKAEGHVQVIDAFQVRCGNLREDSAAQAEGSVD